MNNEAQSKKQKEIHLKKTVTRTKNIPRNWLCRLFGHFPECRHCDPDRETQSMITKNKSQWGTSLLPSQKIIEKLHIEKCV